MRSPFYLTLIYYKIFNLRPRRMKLSSCSESVGSKKLKKTVVTWQYLSRSPLPSLCSPLFYLRLLISEIKNEHNLTILFDVEKLVCIIPPLSLKVFLYAPSVFLMWTFAGAGFRAGAQDALRAWHLLHHHQVDIWLVFRSETVYLWLSRI